MCVTLIILKRGSRSLPHLPSRCNSIQSQKKGRNERYLMVTLVRGHGCFKQERENNIVMALHGEMVHKAIIVNLGDSARMMKNVGSAVVDVVVSFHVLVTLSFVRYRT
jgi:hypothetical protein